MFYPPKPLSRTLIGLIIFAALFSSFVGVCVYFAYFSEEAKTQASLDHLSVCVLNPDDVLSCGREEVQKLLANHKSNEVMSLLSKNVTSGQCHTLGHIVGQETYKKTHNVEAAIAECGYGCTSSCMHGIIGQALIEEVGIDDEGVDPRHL